MSDLIVTKKQFVSFSELADGAAKKTSVNLSKLVGHDTQVQANTAKITSLFPLLESLGESRETVATTIITLGGVVNGVMVLTMPLLDAERLIAGIHGDVSQDGQLSKLEQETLTEMCNILTGSFIAALSSAFNGLVNLSVPNLSVNMLQATLDEVIGSMSLDSTASLAFQSALEIPELSVEAKYLLILDAVSAYKLLQSLS